MPCANTILIDAGVEFAGEELESARAKPYPILGQETFNDQETVAAKTCNVGFVIGKAGKV